VNTHALRGHTTLRTRPNIPVTVELPQKRPCALCGAILRQSNPGPFCIPCTGAYDIPEWVIGLIEQDDRPQVVATMAALITDTGRGNYYYIDDHLDDVRQWRKEGVSQYQIAKRIGHPRATVQQAFRRLAREE
jgi:hypothetical protein